jgi:hypothetical protein
LILHRFQYFYILFLKVFTCERYTKFQKVSVFGFNIWRDFHCPFMYTMKKLEYCRTVAFSLNKLATWKVICFSFWNKTKSKGARSNEYWGWSSTTPFFCFKKSYTIDPCATTRYLRLTGGESKSTYIWIH